MAIPTDRESFAQTCLRRLGAPVIKINISPEQISDTIDRALFKFYERNFNAVEEVYLVHHFNQDDLDRSFMILPNDMVGVSKIWRPNSVGGIFNLDFQFMQSELYQANGGIFNLGNVSYFAMMQSHIDLINRFFFADRSWSYNHLTQKLVILGGLKSMVETDRFIVIQGFRKIQPSDSVPVDDSNQDYVSANIWQEMWLQDYTTALLKRQWAANLSKYQQVQLLGGVTLNGNELMAQAKEEIKELLEQLDSEYQLPTGFYVG